MNQEQFLSATRWVLATGGSFLASRGLIAAETLQSVIGIAMAAIPFIWSMFVHKQ